MSYNTTTIILFQIFYLLTNPRVVTEKATGYEAQDNFLEVIEWCKKDIRSHDDALNHQQLLLRANGIDQYLRENELDILVVPSDARKATRISAMADT